MSDGVALRVAVVTDDLRLADLVRDILAASLPSLGIDVAEPELLRPPPQAAGIIVDARPPRAGAAAGDVVRRIRGSGFTRRLVVVADAPDAAIQAVAARLGASVILTPHLTTELPPLLVDDDRDASAPMRTLAAELRRTQRLLAAGEIALGLQHALNNPLAGLLAEAQLLEMEPLAPEHRDAVRRIVGLCRRTIVLVRQLDGIGRARADTPSPQPIGSVTPV